MFQETFSSFLLSKSRLAPIKEKSLTIPRLELQGTVLAIRLKNTISKQLDFPIDETRFRSDFQIVLKYIANKDTRFPVFVMNRLKFVYTGHLNNGITYQLLKILLTVAHVLSRLAS